MGYKLNRNTGQYELSADDPINQNLNYFDNSMAGAMKQYQKNQYLKPAGATTQLGSFLENQFSNTNSKRINMSSGMGQGMLFDSPEFRKTIEPNKQVMNPIQRDPSLSDKDVDWGGLANVGGNALYNGVSGGLKGLSAAKTANSGAALAKGVGNAAFAKGALGALGGVGGVANIGLSAAKFLPGMKDSDIQDTTGNVIKYGGMAAGLLLGATNPIGLGLSALALANDAFGQTAKKQRTSGVMLADYGTSGYDSLNTNTYGAGKKSSWTANTFGAKYQHTGEINRNVDILNTKRMLASQSGYENKQNLASAQNTFGDINTKNQQQLFGGTNKNILSASKGMKINPAQLRSLVKKSKKSKADSLTDRLLEVYTDESIGKFSEGGKLNVIPDGALHARKHDLPEEIAEQVTAKGIPVITYDEGGEITQHAEIEKNEIIFIKETTDKLEAWFKQYKEADSEEKKSELAIYAGKFLTSEILENTDDRTGLINDID